MFSSEMSFNYKNDLDMGNSLETTSSTNGQTLYWMACVQYRENNGAWQEMTTETRKFDGNGNVLPPD